MKAELPPDGDNVMRARLYKPAKSAMSSGHAKTKAWVMEFITANNYQRDPLMGWNGATDTTDQTALHFEELEDAKRYAEENDIELVVEESAHMPRKPKSYAANFAYGRKQPWTH
jgi:ETC complex I subunit conserved region.